MPLKAGKRLGKYKLQRRMEGGGFSDVFEAVDTYEGIRVALKIPHVFPGQDGIAEELKAEVRINAKLDHPYILPLKNADSVDGVFFMAYPLGCESLADRLTVRLSTQNCWTYTRQILEALAYAHSKRIIHCDVKPDNFILFSREGCLRLSDFGIAKIAGRTLSASGAGTVGYLAPEQALGKPSFRSDVFSAGLVIYRMFAGALPEWPFTAPFPNQDVLLKKTNRAFVRFLLKAIDTNENKRFKNAVRMLETFKKIPQDSKVRRKKKSVSSAGKWKKQQFNEFKKSFGKKLEAKHTCEGCSGPVSESMSCCPWCGKAIKKWNGATPFPYQCRRCNRGMKADWKFCSHCFGNSQGPQSDKSYSDKRYKKRVVCSGCKGSLIPFMRYCPWCRQRVRRNWKFDAGTNKCKKCEWEILPGYWNHCPWCKSSIK